VAAACIQFVLTHVPSFRPQLLNGVNRNTLAGPHPFMNVSFSDLILSY